MPKIRQSTSQINFKNSASIGRVFTPVVSGPPVNLVTNPAFTTNTNDWYTIGYISRDTTFFRSSPASLLSEGYDEYDPLAYYNKSNLLTVGQTYSLSLWLKTFNTQSFTIHLDAGATRQTLTTAGQSSTADWTNYKIENVTCTTNGTLQIYIGCLAPVYIDDVSVVQGPTALVL